MFWRRLLPAALSVIAGKDQVVTAFNAVDGSTHYRFIADGRILSRPAAGSDGTLYVTTENHTLYGLDQVGQARFTFTAPDGAFKTSPVLAFAESLVLVAAEDSVVYAIDTITGTVAWQYATIGKILTSPIVAGNDVLIGTSEGEVIFLNRFGIPSYRTAVSGAIVQAPQLDSSGNVGLLEGDSTVSVLARLPAAWDGRPDVLPTDSRKVWDLASTTAIDIGADILHERTMDREPITGAGVTVAVVDTGIFFSHDVKTELGSQIAHSFAGQADFVDSTCRIVRIKKKETITAGQQFPDHCFLGSDDSKDPYGHGTHIAGIIWNQFTDANTGVTMGIAPDAAVLSVRVLGRDGTGTYEDVIQGIQYVVDNKELFNVRVLNLSLSGYATDPYFVDPAEPGGRSGLGGRHRRSGRRRQRRPCRRDHHRPRQRSLHHHRRRHRQRAYGRLLGGRRRPLLVGHRSDARRLHQARRAGAGRQHRLVHVQRPGRQRQHGRTWPQCTPTTRRHQSSSA